MILSAVFFAGFLLRQVWLPVVALLLINENELQKADVIIVLSGSGYDRGNEAARLFHEGYAPVVICPGGNDALEFEILNMKMKESELAKMNLVRLGVPDSAVHVILAGTGTKEEADTLGSIVREMQLQKVILLTSKIHTARAARVFKKKFSGLNVHLIVYGVPSSRYNEMEWWQTEEGLIAINNEWIKTIYYFFRKRS